MRDRLNRIGEKLNSKQVRYVGTALIVIALVGLILLIKQAADHRTYSSYAVEKSVEKSDNVSQYVYVNGCVLRYSLDGAALIRKDLTTVWNVTYSMLDPRVDVNGTHILIYDRLGTEIRIYSDRDIVSSFAAEEPILEARISEKNTVAALLRNGEKVDFVYYTSEGQTIASGQSGMTDPGYPVAMALSGDGENVAISYLTATGGSTGTHLRFYNFGNGGRSKDNHVTGEDLYDGVVTPDVEYLNGNECVAFRDNGFTVYRGTSSPEAVKSVDFEESIISIFHDGSHMGFVFRSEEKDHRYEMRIYTTAGNLVSTAYVDRPYTRVHVCGNQVIFSSSSDFSIYSMSGFRRFSGKVQGGSVADVLRIGRDRLLALTDYNMEVIRLR